MRRRFHLSKCGLNYDRHDRRHPGCRGPIVMVGTIGLCPRHLALLMSIVREAEVSGVRHPEVFQQWRIAV